MHQFVEAGISLYNPDKPDRPVNSPAAVYQITPEALALLRQYGTEGWGASLDEFIKHRSTLAQKYAMERDLIKVPVKFEQGKELILSPGSHSLLIKAIIEEFAPRFAPGSILVYAGDTGDKWGYFNENLMNELGIKVDVHGKMPDVVLYLEQKNWILLVESVTSHGPVDSKRHMELESLFTGHKELIYITAFPNRMIMARYLPELAWETEVWLADSPSHLIHLNGNKFLGPYK